MQGETLDKFLDQFPSVTRLQAIAALNLARITDALVTAVYGMVGLDTSSGMLTLFRANLPATPPVRGDARGCPFADESFDAAVSWGMMFTSPAPISRKRSQACHAC